jgi:DNA recombination protein RmuC
MDGLIYIVLGLTFGSITAWVVYGRLLSGSRGELAWMKEAQKSEEILRKQMRAEFESLASKTLSASNERFLQLAETKFSATRDQLKSDLEKGHSSFDGLIKPLTEADGMLFSRRGHRVRR